MDDLFLDPPGIPSEEFPEGLYGLGETLLYGLGGLEGQSVVSFDFYRLAGLRIAAGTLGSLDEVEDAQSRNSETPFFPDSFEDGADQAINDGFGGGLANAAFLSQFSY
jgi:hypothetical protein